MEKSKSQKLIKDTLIYGLATFGPKLISFILLPLYTHYFTSAEYGTWDLVVTTISLVSPIVTLELIDSVYRWLIETKRLDDRMRIITTGFFALVKNLMISNLIAGVFFIMFPNNYWWLSLLIINSDNLSGFVQHCVRALGYNKQFAIIGILKTAVSIVFTIFFVFVMHFRIETFFYSMIISNVLGLIYSWRFLNFQQYINIKVYSKDTYKEFIKYSIPLILGAVNWWVMNVSDRYIIAFYLGVKANGIYAVANKLPSLVNVVSSIFYLAWQDNAIREYNNNERDKYYSNIFRHYFRLMVTTVILLTASSRIIMKIMISNQYDSAWKYVGILYLGAMFSTFSNFWGAAYQGSKQTNNIFVTTVIGAISNIVINVALINHIGIYAAAISTFLGFFLMWIMCVLDSKKEFKIQIDYKELAVLLTISFITLFLSFYASIAIDLFIFLVGVVTFVITNGDIIKKILSYSFNYKFVSKIRILTKNKIKQAK